MKMKMCKRRSLERERDKHTHNDYGDGDGDDHDSLVSFQKAKELFSPNDSRKKTQLSSPFLRHNNRRNGTRFYSYQ